MLILLAVSVTIFRLYMIEVDNSLDAFFLRALFRGQHTIETPFNEFIGTITPGEGGVQGVTGVVHEAFLYQESISSIIESLRTEKAVCLNQAYIEYQILKKKGYKCWLIPLGIRNEEGHSAVCVEIQGEYYIADPTNNTFLLAKEYEEKTKDLPACEMTLYWKWRTRNHK